MIAFEVALNWQDPCHCLAAAVIPVSGCVESDRPECSNTQEMMSVDFLDLPVN